MEGIIHVGANRAQEYESYVAALSGALLYVEAIPDLAAEIAGRLDPRRPHYVAQAVVSDTTGDTVQFHVSSNAGLSSSILDLGRHADLYPNIEYTSNLSLPTIRLDDLVEQRYGALDFNVLVIDVQGAELQVLKGAPWLLSQVDAVFLEVSSEPLYKGGCTFLEVCNFLDCYDFIFRTARMHQQGWGDAFFSKKKTRLYAHLVSSLARDKPCQQSSMYKRKYPPSAAVNTCPNPSFNIHTDVADTNPWWEVDLLEVRDVGRIIVLDRPQYEKRAAHLRILLSCDHGNWDCVFDRGGAAVGSLIDVNLRAVARYVRVSIPTSGPLHLRQVIVLPPHERSAYSPPEPGNLTNQKHAPASER